MAGTAGKKGTEMHRKLTIATVLTLAAGALAATLATGFGGAAQAHQGVKNPVVKARMDLMTEIQKDTRLLGDMAKGKAAFDAQRAAAARAALIAAAARIAPAFEPAATSPKSEAAPEIWTDWDDFTDRAARMETAAKALDPGSLDGLRGTLPALGRSCGGCHDAYRITK